MIVLRNSKWRFVCVEDGYLLFEEIGYKDSYRKVKEAKYIDVDRDKVHFLNGAITEGPTWMDLMQENSEF